MYREMLLMLNVLFLFIQTVDHDSSLHYHVPVNLGQSNQVSKD